jgi:hypothetical protein
MLGVIPGGKMKLECKYVSASEAGGEIFQILMKARRDQEDGPYLLLQRAFLEEDEGDVAPCYVETNDRRLTGHFQEIEVELSRNRLNVKLPSPVDETIEANFRATDEEFQRIAQILKVIVQ